MRQRRGTTTLVRLGGCRFAALPGSLSSCSAWPHAPPRSRRSRARHRSRPRRRITRPPAFRWGKSSSARAGSISGRRLPMGAPGCPSLPTVRQAGVISGPSGHPMERSSRRSARFQATGGARSSSSAPMPRRCGSRSPTPFSMAMPGPPTAAISPTARSSPAARPRRVGRSPAPWAMSISTTWPRRSTSSSGRERIRPSPPTARTSVTRTSPARSRSPTCGRLRPGQHRSSRRRCS